MVVFQPDAGDMACFEPLVEATSWISAWRNPHGHPRYEFPAIASGEWNAAGGSIGVAHWGVMTLVLGLLALWRNRRSKHREAMHRLLENRP